MKPAPMSRKTPMPKAALLVLPVGLYLFVLFQLRRLPPLDASLPYSVREAKERDLPVIVIPVGDRAMADSAIPYRPVEAWKLENGSSRDPEATFLRFARTDGDAKDFSRVGEYLLSHSLLCNIGIFGISGASRNEETAKRGVLITHATNPVDEVRDCRWILNGS